MTFLNHQSKHNCPDRFVTQLLKDINCTSPADIHTKQKALAVNAVHWVKQHMPCCLTFSALLLDDKVSQTI